MRKVTFKKSSPGMIEASSNDVLVGAIYPIHHLSGCANRPYHVVLYKVDTYYETIEQAKQHIELVVSNVESNQ